MVNKELIKLRNTIIELEKMIKKEKVVEELFDLDWFSDLSKGLERGKHSITAIISTKEKGSIDVVPHFIPLSELEEYKFTCKSGCGETFIKDEDEYRKYQETGLNVRELDAIILYDWKDNEKEIAQYCFKCYNKDSWKYAEHKEHLKKKEENNLENHGRE